MISDPVLRIENLVVRAAGAEILRDVSMRFRRGSIAAIVGASGSGKSMLAKTVNGLSPPGVRVVSGRVMYAGGDILTLNEPQRRRLRGRGIGLIFQDALSALNPVYTIGEQLREAQLQAFQISRAEADASRLVRRFVRAARRPSHHADRRFGVG